MIMDSVRRSLNDLLNDTAVSIREAREDFEYARDYVVGGTPGLLKRAYRLTVRARKLREDLLKAKIELGNAGQLVIRAIQDNTPMRDDLIAEALEKHDKYEALLNQLSDELEMCVIEISVLRGEMEK